MITAVDSNVILDSLTLDPMFAERSKQALNEAFRSGSMVVSEVVYAEVAGQFSAAELLDRYFSTTGLQLVSAGTDALHRAGQAWVSYVRSRQEGIICTACGRRNQPACDGCKTMLRGRQHLLADFVIGAHALVHADRLLSRDRGYYGRYFPELTVFDPSA